MIITRRNDRQLRTSATDWVKNGDRWTVSSVDWDGGLRVKHRRSSRTVHLPASYVRASVGLGYSTTIHTAQGITADTMHGLLTGAESRQQLYTMCTRGRLSNHIYLQLVGNGDPHTLISPTRYDPRPPPSCSNKSWPETPPQDRPARCCKINRIPPSGFGTPSTLSTRYVAAEQVVGSSAVQAVEGFANRLVPGLTDEPAWPTLCPSAAPCGGRRRPAPTAPCARARAEQCTRSSRCAGLATRRHQPAGSRDGPLPWLPGIPDRIAADPTWGPYLGARSHGYSTRRPGPPQRPR